MGQPGSPWTIQRALRDARDKLDLPDDFRFHDLRHYFASLLIASGLDVKVVQARLRHASAKTTLDTYGHLWPDRDNTSRAAVAAVYRKGNNDGLLRTRHRRRLLRARPRRPPPSPALRGRGGLRHRRHRLHRRRRDHGIRSGCEVRGRPGHGLDLPGAVGGEEADQAAVDLELSYEDWCDPLT
ncbi:tyrosine-type recombinase/integrase [Oerskovia sp. M15]